MTKPKPETNYEHIKRLYERIDSIIEGLADIKLLVDYLIKEK